jgi:transposase
MHYVRVSKQYYCGVDLHADVMYVCVMTKAGRIVFHHELPTDFPRLLQHLKPYLSSIAVCAESTFNWYWLADGCAQHNIPFFLGHALYMKLIHGGKTKNDRIDAKVMADLLRTGFFPPAYPYPERMRATRDLLRRRSHFSQQHAEALRHIKTLLYQQGYMDLPSVHNYDAERISETFSGYKLPDDAAYSLQADLDMIRYLDTVTAKLEWRIEKNARGHDNHALALLKSVKGLGTILSLTLLYEIHTIERFKSPQRFSSYSRVVKMERSSHGKRLASRNNKIGNPYLRWVFGQLAISAQRFYPEVKNYTQKLIRKYGNAKAYTLLAHKFAVTIYYMLKNKTSFDVTRFVAA